MTGAEDVTQWLRAVPALPQDMGLFPAPTRQLTSICNSTSNGSTALFCSQETPGIHMVHTHTQAGTTLVHIK